MLWTWFISPLLLYLSPLSDMMRSKEDNTKASPADSRMCHAAALWHGCCSHSPRHGAQPSMWWSHTSATQLQLAASGETFRVAQKMQKILMADVEEFLRKSYSCRSSLNKGQRCLNIKFWFHDFFTHEDKTCKWDWMETDGVWSLRIHGTMASCNQLCIVVQVNGHFQLTSKALSGATCWNRWYYRYGWVSRFVTYKTKIW